MHTDPIVELINTGGWANPDYKSSACPPGYDTVVGYLMEHDPVTWAMMDQTADSFRQDDYLLKRRAKLKGVPTKHIASPPWLVRQGIFEVRSFPISFLREYFGESAA